MDTPAELGNDRPPASPGGFVLMPRRGPPLRLPLLVKAAIWVAMVGAVFRELLGHYSLIQIGAFDLASTDLMIGLALAASGQLVLRHGLLRRSWLSFPLLALAALASLSLLRGLTIDPMAALMSMRNTWPVFVYPLLALLLAARPYRFRDMTRPIIATAIGIAFLALLRLVAGPETLFWGDFRSVEEINDGGRVLTSAGCLLMGVAAIILASRIRFTNTYSIPHSAFPLALLLVAVFISYQATATAATLAGLASIVALRPGSAWKLRLAATSIMLLLALSIMFSNALALAPDWLVGDFAQRSQNLNTRRLVWDTFLADYGNWSWLNQALGLAAGMEPVLFISFGAESREWSVSLHNMYLGVLAWTGAFGLLSYLGLLILILARAVRDRAVGGELPPVLGFALALTLAVFGYSYEVRAEQGLFLGIAVLAVARLVFAPRMRALGPPVAFIPAEPR